MVDNTAFDAIASKYMNHIFRLAFSYLKSYYDADDITQNVLLNLYQTKYEFENEYHLKNWLMKVTANECRKFWRHPFSRHKSIDDYSEILSFENTYDHDLFAAIMKLDCTKRLTLILYYIEGYSIKEISEILKIPAATVGTRLSRARNQLKEYLKEED